MTLPNSEDIQFNIIYDKENQQIGDAGTTDYLFFADAEITQVINHLSIFAS